jgi:hypothetical protein
VKYVDRFDEIVRKVSGLEKMDKILKQRLTIVEKESEKTGRTRSQIKQHGTFSISSSFNTILEPNCINRKNCRTCLEDSKCIWCDKSQKCKLGDISGTYDGSCSKHGEFHYSSCQNESFCNNFSNCTDCINNASCGWCGELNSCVEGGYKSPIGMMCVNGYVHKFAEGRCSIHSKYNNLLH